MLLCGSCQPALVELRADVWINCNVEVCQVRSCDKGMYVNALFSQSRTAKGAISSEMQTCCTFLCSVSQTQSKHSSELFLFSYVCLFSQLLLGTS